MKRYIIVGGILLSFFIIYQWLKVADYFKMGSPIINGLNRIKREEILKIAGITPGMNILSLDIKTIKNRIRFHPWVRDVSVRREFPNRLIINVAEREPTALININGLFYVDRNGNIFKRVEACDSYDYPIITGISRDDDYSSFMNKVNMGIRFLNIAKPLMDIISEVNVSEDGIIIYTMDGVMVNIGEDDYRKKVIRLNKILIDLRERSKRAKLIDLDYRDIGIVKISKGKEVRE
jgi:cell division protein FtsQ